MKKTLTIAEENIIHCALLEYRSIVRYAKDETGYFKPYKNGSKDALQKKIDKILQKI